MANYPSLPIYAGTELQWEDGLVIERATSGTLRARSFFTAAKAMPRIAHTMLTRDQIHNVSPSIGLNAFYNAWKAGTSPFSAPLEPFNVTIDSILYLVVFVRKPSWRIVDYNIYDATVMLAQV